MKLYSRSRFNVVFLVPVAMAATGDGCATTPKYVDIAPTEIVKLLSNNTVGAVDENIFAHTLGDGTMRGLNVASGGTRGKWWVNKKGHLCADWEDDQQEVRCDKLQYSADKTYLWMETKLKIVKGNPNNL